MSLDSLLRVTFKDRAASERNTRVELRDYGIRVGVLELRVSTSNHVKAKLPPRQWSDRARKLEQRRRRKGGAAKGRVIYILDRTGAALAFLAYHVETNGIDVWSIDCALNVPASQQKQLEAALLLFARRIAGKVGPACR